MMTRRLWLAFALAFVLVATLACDALSNLASTGPSVSNIRMATDASGKTTTTAYAPGDAFYVFADLKGLSAGSVVEARWYAVNAQGVGPNAELNTSDYTYQPGIGFVYFQLTTNDGSDWPAGSYRVELYLDGSKVGEQGFSVQ